MSVERSDVAISDMGVRLERAPRRLPTVESRAEFERLRALAPKGSRLSTMTPNGAKREIERRYQG